MNRHRQSEEGAATVEFALLAILLFMLIFGGISAGIAISQANALQTAAREGVRFGATLPDASSNLGSVVNVVKSAATGDLDDSVPGQYICVSFFDGNTATTVTETSGSPGTLGTDCYSDKSLIDNRPAGEERIQVVVERDTTIEAIVFSTDVTVSSDAVARYER